MGTVSTMLTVRQEHMEWQAETEGAAKARVEVKYLVDTSCMKT
jgi:hypothetical protein